MPFSYEIRADEQLEWVTARGKIDFQSCIAALNELAGHPEHRPYFKIIADFRGVKYTPSLGDLRGFASAAKQMRAAYQNRIALIVNPGLHYALGRTACALGKLIRFAMCTFKEEAKARRWVEEVAPVQEQTNTASPPQKT
jgi:hypothetical protein